MSMLFLFIPTDSLMTDDQHAAVYSTATDKHFETESKICCCEVLYVCMYSTLHSWGSNHYTNIFQFLVKSHNSYCWSCPFSYNYTCTLIANPFFMAVNSVPIEKMCFTLETDFIDVCTWLLSVATILFVLPGSKMLSQLFLKYVRLETN